MSDLERTGTDKSQRNLILGIVIAVAAVGAALTWAYRDSLFGHGTSRLERELGQAAELINRRAPIRVDEVTTLTGARAEGSLFTYQYSLSEDIPTERIREAEQLLQRDIGARLCADPNMGRAVREGAVISADYRDPSGDRLHITFRSCPPAAR
jgi:hypothetical protein